MAEQNELDRLYAEAKSALKKREYDRATGLLTQILVIDENYRDVSRLLAKTVKLKRRRWYNHPALWGALGIILLAGLGFLLSKVLPQATAPAAQPIASRVAPSVTALLPTATMTLTPTATPIPLTWKRISMGLEFERDTVTAFATDKKDLDVIYAAMKNSGVYKTIDGGNSWFPSHHGLSNTQVESLVIDSQNPQILYAGTMGGVFKTDDGGENWFRVSNGTYLLMDYQDNSHLYARDENGIYETEDQGNTWITAYTLKKDCPDEIVSWALHPKDGNMLFIGGGETCAGVYQSVDGGKAWTLFGMEDKPDISALAIGLDENENFSVYANFLSPGLETESGIYASYGGGATWANTFVTRNCQVLTVDPDYPSDIYCGNSSALSIKQGREHAWEAIPDTQAVKFSAIHIDHPNGTDRVIIGGRTLARYQFRDQLGVGIFVSVNGGKSWDERDNGIGSARVEFTIDPTNKSRAYLATYYGGCTLYRSLDDGKNWASIHKGAWCGPVFDTAHTLYLNQNGILQKSWDGGDTWLWDPSDPKWSPSPGGSWTELDRYVVFALPNSYTEGIFQANSQSISVNPYTEELVYDVGDVIWYSENGGGDWQQSVGSEGSWDGRLFYTDQSKMIFDIGRYHQKYSTDNGKTWQACGQDVTASRSDTRLALDLQGSHLYLATPGQGVMISTDQCQSWQASNNGLTNLFVNTLAIDPNDVNKIYAGTDGGAYISFDAGATWGQVNDGLLGAVVVYSIVVDKESNVYAATPYGVFKLENK